MLSAESIVSESDVVFRSYLILVEHDFFLFCVGLSDWSPFFPLLRHSYQSLDKLVVLLLSLRGPAFLLVQPSTFGNSKFSLISDQNTVKLTYT